MPNLRDDYDEPHYGEPARRDYGGIDAGYRGGGSLGGGWSGGRRFPEPYRGQSGPMGRPVRDDRDELFGPAWRDDRSDVERHARMPRRPSFRGRGPKNYVRSDESIAEDLHWHLTDAIDVDAIDIEVAVSNGEVHLRGSVLTRDERARAEELAQHVLGVKHVINEIEVRRPDLRGMRF